MEIIKGVIFIIASVIMLGVIALAPEISGSVSVFYVMILSGYLGLDILNMIKTTSVLPPGEFKRLKVNRYVIGFACYAVLIGFAFYKAKISDVDFGGMFSVLVSAIFIMVSMLIGGLEGNKIATKYGPIVSRTAELSKLSKNASGPL